MTAAEIFLPSFRTIIIMDGCSSSSNDNNDTSNTCVICLEPLATDSIGTCVPCGHCFHETCWTGWKGASSSSLNNCNPKCPMCNNASTAFCKIFLDFSALENNHKDSNDEDDDELSWSTEVSSESPPQEPKATVAKEPLLLGNFVDLVNDDNNDETTTTAAAALETKAKRYKKTTKSLLKHVTLLESRHDQKLQQLQQLTSKYQALQSDLTHLQEEQTERDAAIDATCQAVDEAQAVLKRTRLEEMAASKQAQQLRSQLQKARADLSRLQKNGAADINKASVHVSMPEVKRALQDYPKVVQEIQRLESIKIKLQQRLASLLQQQQQEASRSRGAAALDTNESHHQSHPSIGTNSTTTQTHQKKSLSSAKVLLREMSLQREANEQSQRAEAAKLQRRQQERQRKSHLSQHAAQIMANMASKQQQQPSFHAHQRQHHVAAAPHHRPMDSLALLNRADQQRQQQQPDTKRSAAAVFDHRRPAAAAAGGGIQQQIVSKKKIGSVTTPSAATGVNLLLRPTAGAKRATSTTSRQTTLSAFRVKKYKAA